VIHHTNCGMEFFTDDVMRQLLASSLETAELGPDGFQDVGQGPGSPEARYIDWLTMTDNAAGLADDVARIRAHPLVPGRIPIHGYIYGRDERPAGPRCRRRRRPARLPPDPPPAPGRRPHRGMAVGWWGWYKPISPAPGTRREVIRPKRWSSTSRVNSTPLRRRSSIVRVDVIAHEEQLMGAAASGVGRGMRRQLRRRQVEYEPAAAGIHVVEAEHVTEEFARFAGRPRA